MVDLLFGFSVVSNLERRKSPNVRHKNGKSASHPSTSFAKGAALRARSCVRGCVHVMVECAGGYLICFLFWREGEWKGGSTPEREKGKKRRKEH